MTDAYAADGRTHHALFTLTHSAARRARNIVLRRLCEDSQLLHGFLRQHTFAKTLSDLEVQTGALNGIGTNLAVGYCYVLRMYGVALQSLFTLKCTVEHHVCIR